MSRFCTGFNSLARWPLPALAVLASVVLLGGCASSKALRTANAPTLYKMAHKDMVEGDTTNAAKTYESLISRFPFTSQARQARLDLIYVYYRKGDKDSASDAADEFLHEEPTNPRDDYAQYMKGMIYFERTTNVIERWLGVDMARKPPVDLLKSIAAFNIVVTQYPHSTYAHDALRRMTYLRNRLAQYDVYVATYYVRRGAYLAAAQRANEVVTEYDGAPAERQALQIMITCYQRLGLNDLVANVQRVYEMNFQAGGPATLNADTGAAASGTTAKTGAPVKHWWELWR